VSPDAARARGKWFAQIASLRSVASLAKLDFKARLKSLVGDRYALDPALEERPNARSA